MTIKNDQRAELIKFLRQNKISYKLTSPKTITSSVKNANAILITIKEKNKLKDVTQKINQLNQNHPKDSSIQVAVIGGGRGGNNQSYSIEKLWKGVDVFFQLVWPLEFNVLPQDEMKSSDSEAVCRVSPNMMLIELNKYLYANGYHCPTLFGSLTFMSIAGGLSTNSHTSYGYLSEIVQGIEVLLPNGETKYFSKKDKNFNLFCQNASLGLLGIITAVDINVKKESKKLKRIIEFSTYDQFMKKIREETAQGIPLDSRSIIFSSVNLKNNSPVKLTRWEWVSSSTPNQGVAEVQLIDDSFVGRSVLPMLATKYPKILSKFFNQATLSSAHGGVTISPPAEIMGPEARMVGRLTEMGINFAYNEKLDNILNKLSHLLNEKMALNLFPVNTAVFLRFPKKRDSNEYRVAMDFASMGLNITEMKEFVNEIIAYLDSEGIQAGVHYGKSNGIVCNKSLSSSSDSWDGLKIQYQQYYRENNLDENILSQRLIALENTETTSYNRAFKNTLS